MNNDIIILSLDCKKINKKEFELSTLKNIVMPGVEFIDDFAFNNCIELTEFDTQNVTKMGKYIFIGSRLIKCIIRKLKEIETDIFTGSNYLKHIILSNAVKKINKYAFNKLNIVYINLDNVEIIEQNAFENCRSLQNINLNSITKLSNFAFKNCDNLKNVVIGKNCKIIGYSTFENCISLKEVLLNEGLEVIEFAAFKNCKSLQNINFVNTIKKINTYAFEFTGINEVILRNIEYLGDYVFSNSKVKNVYLGHNLLNFNTNNVEKTINANVYLYNTTEINDNIYNASNLKINVIDKKYNDDNRPNKRMKINNNTEIEIYSN